MANLTSTAETTRKLVAVAGIMLVSLVVGRVMWTYGVALYKALNPPPPPPATLGFGALPRIKFTDNDVGELSFKLETVGEVIPTFGPTAKVFKVSYGRSGFLDLDRAKVKAAALGFVLDPELVSGTLYRWTKSEPLPSVLDLDVVNNRFNLEISWETDPGFLNNNSTPTQEQAISEARVYLRGAQFLPKDLENGETRTTLLRYTGGRLVETVSLSEADFVQVDLFRQLIDGKYRVLPADPYKGLARLLISSAQGLGRRVVKGEYVYTEVDYQQVHTYPTITGPEAWQSLISGNGFIASVPSKGKQAVVRRVDLGYFDSLDRQGYLQPVYIFEGDDNFVGYVPAIQALYFQEERVETAI